MKKYLVVILAVLMLFTLAPGMTMADESITENYTGNTTEEAAETEQIDDETDSLNLTSLSDTSSKSMNIYGIYLGSNKSDSGDAVLVESDGEYLLMDMGGVSSYSTVKKFLKKLGVTTLSLYFSHLHSDHTGGLSAGNGYDRLLQDFNVKKVYVPSKEIFKDSAGRKALKTKYAQIPKLYERNGYSKKDIVYLNVGDTFSFGDVSAKVMGPVGVNSLKLSKMSSDAYFNNLSLITMLTCGKTKFLTTGDTELYEAKKLMKKYGKSLKADIYKMPHHANGGSSSPEFLSYIKPSYSFGLNSGKVDFLKQGKLKYRKTYRARKDAAEYGIVYLTGDEHLSVKYSVQNGKIRMYTSKDSFAEPLSGLIKLKGGSMIPLNYKEKSGMDPYLYSYYYIKKDGTVFTGVKTIKGKKYLFGSGGCMEVGHYYQEGTKIIYRVFEKYTVGKTYYMRSFEEKTGAMRTGWFKYDGKRYFFNKKTGYRLKGIKVFEINNKKYLFAGSGYAMTNVYRVTSKGVRYFGSNGVMVTGWITIDGYRQYFDPKTGYRQ